nr:immunoglobulin heavy chain junction region [Mus musculus]
CARKPTYYSNLYAMDYW